jgi:hypothetical protein
MNILAAPSDLAGLLKYGPYAVAPLTLVGLRQDEYPCLSEPFHERTGSAELLSWLIQIWSHLCCSPI